MKLEAVKTDLLLAREAIDQALELVAEPRTSVTTWHVFLARQVIAARDAIERIVTDKS